MRRATRVWAMPKPTACSGEPIANPSSCPRRSDPIRELTMWLRRLSLVLSILAFSILLPLCAQVRFKQAKGRISVEIDGQPYTDFFLAADGNKPYVYPLRTASGLVVTRHFPMEQFPGETHDHPHHRGMFFSHGDINGHNFWATEPGSNGPKNGRMAL